MTHEDEAARNAALDKLVDLIPFHSRILFKAFSKTLRSYMPPNINALDGLAIYTSLLNIAHRFKTMLIEQGVEPNVLLIVEDFYKPAAILGGKDIKTQPEAKA